MNHLSEPDMESLVVLVKQSVSQQTAVLTSDEDLQPYNVSCEGKKPATKMVVKVADNQDISALLALAQECANTPYAFSLYPLSTGHNWGYSSSSPNCEHSIVLDLSLLKRITCEDEKLGIFTVEPGVTQGDLRQYLERAGLKFMVPVTGAGASCSIMGNALERGYGITPFTDHFGAVNSVRGFMADGSFFKSAVAELDGSGHDFIDKTYKYGVGPYLDGLWTQSNLIVVTEISLRLKAEPEAFCAFYLQLSFDEEIVQAQEITFKILQKLDGVVGSINIMDRRRVIAMLADNPNGADSHEVMRNEQVHVLSRKFEVPGWTIVGTLYGQRRVVDAAKKEIKRFAAGDCSRMLFSDSAMITAARLVLDVLPDSVLRGQRKLLRSLDSGVEIMRGRPSQVALPLAYWRNPHVKPDQQLTLNPALDRCGLLWYAPLVPMDGATMARFVEHVREVCPKYGIEPMITFTSLKYDSVDSTIPIVFNASDPFAAQQAYMCLDELVRVGLTMGWVPYRLNQLQQKTLLDGELPFWKVSQAIKTALDPNNIISPGRYQP